MSLEIDTIENLESLQSYVGDMFDHSPTMNEIVSLMASYIDEAPAHFYEHVRERIEAKKLHTLSNTVEISVEKLTALVDLALGMRRQTGQSQTIGSVMEAVIDFAKKLEDPFYSFCIARAK